MTAPLKFIYIDNIEGFTEVGRYPVDGQWRIAYSAPLPNLAIIITRDVEISTFLNQTVGVFTGLCEPRQPGAKHAWGHFPQLRQSKISIIAAFTTTNARQTLAELLLQGPQYHDDAYHLEMDAPTLL